ncbi:MAG: rRNA maturation RNase YbeY [bacterium]
MPSPYKILLKSTVKEIIPRTALFKAIRLALREEKFCEPCELSLFFCDDETIRRLNREYRGKDVATDVLSFSQREGDLPPEPLDGTIVLGDIVISVPFARRQAERLGRDLEEELIFLSLHGLLHLLGYEDESPSASARMDARVRFFTGMSAAKSVGKKKSGPAN